MYIDIQIGVCVCVYSALYTYLYVYMYTQKFMEVSHNGRYPSIKDRYRKDSFGRSMLRSLFVVDTPADLRMHFDMQAGGPQQHRLSRI